MAAVVVGEVVLAAPLVLMAATAFTSRWRHGIVDYVTVALAPTVLMVVALLVLAARRRPVAAWTLVALAVVLVSGVIFGGFVYEEWLETQPGGRGYSP